MSATNINGRTSAPTEEPLGETFSSSLHLSQKISWAHLLWIHSGGFFLCGGGAIVTKGIKDDGIDVIPSFDCVSFSSSWEVRRYLTVPTVASSASGGWLGGLVQLFQPPNSPTRTYD